MDNKIKTMLSELEDNINNDSLYVYEENLVNTLDNYDDKESYIEEIFGIMEKYPLIDWGMPGALVHFLESFDNEVYEKHLLNSLSRQPALQTIWMLNRQINSVNIENREPYLKIMRQIAGNNDLAKEITESARGFVEYQERVINSYSQPKKENGFNSLEQIFDIFRIIPKDK